MPKWFLLLILIISADLAVARERSIFKIETPVLAPLTWAVGDGDLIWTAELCVASSNYNNTTFVSDSSPIMVKRPYKIRVRDLKADLGYNFYLDNLATSVGNARVKATFKYTDLKNGAATNQELLDDQYKPPDIIFAGEMHTGQYKSCLDGKNLRLEMTIDALALTGARAGNYIGNFRLQGRGGTDGTKGQGKALRFGLDIAQSVQVSGLNDIEFGQWDGLGPLSATESFCVFSNNNNAGYTVDIGTDHQIGDQHRMATSGNTTFINYNLTFDDSEAGAGTLVEEALPISGLGNNSATDCGSSNNANVTVTVAETDLREAETNEYDDVITLLIRPE